MVPRLATLALLGCLGAAPSASAQDAQRAVNRADSVREWRLEPVAGLDFVRVRLPGTPAHFHIERGRVELGIVEPGWWSAQWRIERLPEGGLFRLRNRWKPEQFLYVDAGEVRSGPVPPGLRGAQWEI